MQVIAFVLALVAVFCFLGAAYLQPPAGGPRRFWHLGWLGLAFLTVSWMVQIIVLTGSHMKID